MRFNQHTIFRFRALLVLLVFGVSLLPRQVLHNFVSNHKHVKYSGHPGKAQLSAETFNCKADDVFLQQTYNAVQEPEIVLPVVIAAQTSTVAVSPVYHLYVPDIPLRGPPALS